MACPCGIRGWRKLVVWGIARHVSSSIQCDVGLKVTCCRVRAMQHLPGLCVTGGAAALSCLEVGQPCFMVLGS